MCDCSLDSYIFILCASVLYPERDSLLTYEGSNALSVIILYSNYKDQNHSQT